MQILWYSVVGEQLFTVKLKMMKKIFTVQANIFRNDSDNMFFPAHVWHSHHTEYSFELVKLPSLYLLVWKKG